MTNKIKFFFYGIITALGAMFVELVIKNILSAETTLATNFFTIITPSLILFALTEELFKFFIINKTTATLKKSVDIFYGSLFIGLGFAIAEISLLIAERASFVQDNYSLALLGIMVIHLTTSLLFGYFSFHKNLSTFITTIAIATILHLTYNGLVVYDLSTAIVLTYLVGLFILSAFASFGLIKKGN
jgi:hypothetical protein